MQGHVPAVPQAQPGWGRLSIYTSHNPLAWMLYFVSTSIEINGQAQKQPWGTTTYDLAEGVYSVRVYFNYLFGPAGIGETQVQIYAGHDSYLNYRPPFFVFSPANLIEAQRRPFYQLPAGS